jgi:RNA polymerase sigma-70 factor (ECF subfamily)
VAPSPATSNPSVAAILSSQFGKIGQIGTIQAKWSSGRQPRSQGTKSSHDTETTIMVSAIHGEMLAVMPQLRAFAVALCRSRDQADELVQETLLRACDNITKFEPGTNMTAWLITILRHQFYSEYRKRRRDVQDVNGYYVKTMVTRPHQIGYTEYRELLEAIAKLPKEMREALILVGARGVSYPEAARICGCPTGTIKSRVHRARACLAALLSIDSVADLAADPQMQSIQVCLESARGAPRTHFSR